MQNKGIKGALLAVYYRRLYPLHFFTGIFIIALFWLIKPFKQIKVGKLFEERLGHLAQEPELFLRQQQLGMIAKEPLYIFLIDQKKVANQQLYKMLKRELYTVDSQFLLSVYFLVLPILKNTQFFQPLSHKTENCLEFAKASPVIKFTAQENRRGEETLSRLGFVNGKDWFVCIFARDAAYLNKTIPQGDWRYHNITDFHSDNSHPHSKPCNQPGLATSSVRSNPKMAHIFSTQTCITPA